MAVPAGKEQFIRRIKRNYRICRCGGGLVQDKAFDGRPLFICTRCDAHFTNGRSGGEYAKVVPMRLQPSTKDQETGRE